VETVCPFHLCVVPYALRRSSVLLFPDGSLCGGRCGCKRCQGEHNDSGMNKIGNRSAGDSTMR